MRNKSKTCARMRTMVGDDFYTVALERAEERYPIYTADNECWQPSRRAKLLLQIKSQCLSLV